MAQKEERPKDYGEPREATLVHCLATLMPFCSDDVLILAMGCHGFSLEVKLALSVMDCGYKLTSKAVKFIYSLILSD